MLEGILGQLFLITVVARLVSVATFKQAKALSSGGASSETEAERT